MKAVAENMFVITCSCLLANGEGKGIGPEETIAGAPGVLARQDFSLLICCLMRGASKASCDVVVPELRNGMLLDAGLPLQG